MVICNENGVDKVIKNLIVNLSSSTYFSVCDNKALESGALKL